MTQVYVFKVYTRFTSTYTRKVEDACSIAPEYMDKFTHIFEQRVGFEQQISIKAKLVEYTC